MNSKYLGENSDHQFSVVKGLPPVNNLLLVVRHEFELPLESFFSTNFLPDSIQSSGEIAEHERLKLVKTILNDNMMEDFLDPLNGQV